LVVLLPWLAFVLAATPLDPPHAAVLAALRADRDAVTCDPGRMRTMASEASIRTLGRVGADRVVLGDVHDPCICGAQNCKFYAIRLSATPRVLFAQYGIAAHVVPGTGALPDVVVGEHDSAAVIFETRYAYRGGTYAIASYERVRVDTEARKPDSVRVRFAPGGSSARLRGSASVGWNDGYTFDAQRGQRIVIDAVRSRAPVRITLFAPNDTNVVQLQPGTPYRLPASATYRLYVDVDAEADTPYELTLAIR
jgi:hypothetical protein